MNTKKIALWLAIIAIGSFTLAGVIFYYSGDASTLENPGISIHGKYTREIDEKRELQLSGLRNLNVLSSSTDIKFIPTDDTVIRAHLYGTVTSNNERYFPVLKAANVGDSGEIGVEWPKVVNIGFSNSNIKLDIYLPKAYSENLGIETSAARVDFDELNVSGLKCVTSSGDVYGRSVKAENAELRTSSGRFELSIDCSGDLQLESNSGDFVLNHVIARGVTRTTSSGVTTISDMECDSLKYNADSGDLKILSLKAVNTSIESSAGRIEVNGSSTEKALAKSNSGDIVWEGLLSKSTGIVTSAGKVILKGSPGNLEHKSNSGDAVFDFDTFAGQVNIETSSGDVQIKLPQDSQFGLDYKSSSGNMTLEDFEITVKGPVEDNELSGNVGNGNSMIKIRSTSGDAKIGSK
jgi:DUF4097 and DUF4098 domain-containing protein YvlB